MVVLPVISGLFGIEVDDAGRRLTVAPQLPATWDRAAVRGLSVGTGRYDVVAERAASSLTLRVEPQGTASVPALVLAPVLPLDARVQSVTANGRPVPFESQPRGDVQRVQVALPAGSGAQSLVIAHGGGTEVMADAEPLRPGATSQGLRLLRVRPGEDALRLTLEGRAGRTYDLHVRTPRRLEDVAGVTVGPDGTLRISFEGPTGEYTRREVVVPFR
jgi:hypothetical protein